MHMGLTPRSCAQGAHSLEGREQANTERQCSESLLDRRAYDTKDTHKTSFPFSSWLHHMACRILVPQPGIKPESSAVRLWSPRHWTIREFPKYPLCRAWRAKVWWCPFYFNLAVFSLYSSFKFFMYSNLSVFPFMTSKFVFCHVNLKV